MRKSEDLIQTDQRPRYAGDWFRRKAAIKAAVTEAGLWRAFVSERARLYGVGLPPVEAWEDAYRAVIAQAGATNDFLDWGQR